MSGDLADRSSPGDDAWGANLASWMARYVPGGAGPLRIDRLSGGASNLTFRIRGPAGDRVLRLPPLERALGSSLPALRGGPARSLPGAPLP